MLVWHLRLWGHRPATSMVTCATVFIVSWLSACQAFAITADNVLVLYNQDSPDGQQIAEYYADVHPGVSLLGLDGVSTSEQISEKHYLEVIRPQVLAGLHDDIEVIVTTKGMPLRIKNESPNPMLYSGWRGSVYGIPISNGWWEPYSSLESELTRIDRIDSANLMGDQAEFFSPPAFPFSSNHQAANPYFDSGTAFSRSDHEYEGIRLTSRLDGFSVDDVIVSIDRAQQAISLPDGQCVLVDDDPSAPAAYADLMPDLVEKVLAPSGQSYYFEPTEKDVTSMSSPVIGYHSHGAHAAGAGYIDNLTLDIAPGAVFHTWESYNAYSFNEGGNRYDQGLIAEWIRAGGTAGLGHVAEPGASRMNVTNEDIFWEMLLDGHSFVEAAWAATPQLSFVNTVVGDPLMRLRDWSTGDADLDGRVGVSDLNIVLANWSRRTTAGMAGGDLDFDGWVGVSDLNVLLVNWGKGYNNFATHTHIPEPSMLAVFAPIVATNLVRRRRVGQEKLESLRAGKLEISEAGFTAEGAESAEENGEHGDKPRRREDR